MCKSAGLLFFPPGQEGRAKGEKERHENQNLTPKEGTTSDRKHKESFPSIPTKVLGTDFGYFTCFLELRLLFSTSPQRIPPCDATACAIFGSDINFGLACRPFAIPSVLLFSRTTKRLFSGQRQRVDWKPAQTLLATVQATDRYDLRGDTMTRRRLDATRC